MYDESIVRESTRDWLKDASYKVATVENGEETLKMIEAQNSSVIVVDVRPPEYKGEQQGYA
jgi:DNA-binding NtrC family response regulator